MGGYACEQRQVGGNVFDRARCHLLFDAALGRWRAAALAALRRSDIQGSRRYLLMAVHFLWFVIGGLILLAAVFLKIIFPLFQRWVT